MYKKILSFSLVTLLTITSTLAFADWDEGADHKMHWPQLPDLDPTGVEVCMYGDIYPYASLADDFRCTESGPITDIHIWGSFQDEVKPSGGPGTLTFQIKILSESFDG